MTFISVLTYNVYCTRSCCVHFFLVLRNANIFKIKFIIALNVSYKSARAYAFKLVIYVKFFYMYIYR